MQSEIRQILSSRDEAFNPDATEVYSLFAQVGNGHVSWCVLDNEKNKYVCLESFRNRLEDLSSRVPVAPNPFRPVKVIVESNCSTLVPSLLFDREEKDLYLDFLHDREPDDEVRFDRLDQMEMVNVYSVPAYVVRTVSEIFPGSSLFHHSSALIKCLWMNFKNRINRRKMFLHVREHDFDLLVYDGRQIEFYNTFHFQAPADIIYFVIFVMEQMDLNPEETGLILMGNIDRDSDAFRLLYKYIRNIEFTARNDLFNYSYTFDNIPPHHHYLLLNFRICGL
jgi:hypothetical protein